MLNVLTVSNYATYKTEIQRLGPLNRINFVFGNNGSGKTSLTRLLCKQETELPAGCDLGWARGNRLVPYVYNVDYVRKNFVASDRIPGVFSLGSEDVTLKKRLDEFDEKISGLTGKISKLTAALNGDGSLGTNYARAVLDQAKEKLIDFFLEECQSPV